MHDTTEIKIIGIDSKRPPLMKNVPYIDLVFELSTETSTKWNNDFASLFKNSEVKPKIDEKESLYIHTWTRTMEEIPAHVELLKKKILECNQMALDRQTELDAIARADSQVTTAISGPQIKLNDIIATLNFD